MQSGAGVTNQGQTFLDNVSLQIPSSIRAVSSTSVSTSKLVTDTVLEGEFTETGVGYVIRRKMSAYSTSSAVSARRRRPTLRRRSSVEAWKPRLDTLLTQPSLTSDSMPTLRYQAK